MTSESTPAPPDEEEMGSQLSRLARPFLLAAPLMAATLVPAVFYGQRSRSVAAEANQVLIAALAEVDEGPSRALSRDALCDPAAADSFTMTFSQVDLGDKSHKSSISGLGFDAATVDLKGWVDEPSGTIRDDIIVRLKRSGDRWCITNVKTLVAEAD